MSIVVLAKVPCGHLRVAGMLVAFSTAAGVAHATDDPQVADQASSSVPEVVITAQHLNEERSRIDTDTGAIYNHSDEPSS